jgi:medium-chain acyl-[acyl-carrier-protein] hydrolase
MVNSLAWLATGPVSPEARVRLFCLPQAGGGAGDFDLWPKEISSSLDLCPVQLPGRQDRFVEPAFRNMMDLVSELAVVVAENADLPFAIFGHCMGALIAFEIVRELRRKQEPLPLYVFLSSYVAPQNSEVDLAKRIYCLPEKEFIERIRERSILDTDSLDNPELLKLMLPLLRADYSLCETYRYDVEAPLKCPIAVYGAESDPALKESDIAAWRSQTQATFSLRMVPGENKSLHRNSIIIQDVVSTLSSVVDLQSNTDDSAWRSSPLE